LATVITSLASAIPVVGNHIVAWLWGGFSVDNPTLNRFYSFHYLFPFLLAALSLAHLAALHMYGSTNPLGLNAQTDLIDFYPYFYVKDLVATLGLSLFAALLVGFYPEVLGHPDNNIPANPYSTPAHIVPEWYFLWVYAILRSIPNKLAGVVAILLVFVSLALLPYAHKPVVRSPVFRSLHQNLAWAFIGDFLLLTYLGHQPVEAPYVFLGQGATVLFFVLLGAMCVAAWADQWLAGAYKPIISQKQKSVLLA
jgi:ubiquinol-cytochrome c reductase cytochrome b subunit